MKLAIIPARAGSKRIIDKNIRSFGGKPMIHWPLEVALDSRLFDHVVVTTDDERISEVARQGGAQVPFLRPDELSDDYTPLRPVIKNAIVESEKTLGGTADVVCCILATAAFIRVEDLTRGAELIRNPEVNFAFCATPFPAPIQRGLHLTEDGGVAMLHPENRFERSQDLEECFYDVGQFYWGKRAPFMDDDYMYGPKSRPVFIDQKRARDIDTEEDWQEAEFLLEILNAQINKNLAMS